MTTDRPDQVKRLFDAASMLEAKHRQAFLDALDPDLRKEVESLLDAERESFLEKTPPGVDSIAVDDATPIRPMDRAQVRDRIGPYRILREIGEGGMGVVYEASGIDITADIYPYRAWNSGFSWLTTLFPDRDLDRRDGAEYILHDMLSPEGILLAIYKPEPAYDGMTIAEIADIRGSDPETTLMELLKAEMAMDGEESGSQILAFAMDEPDIESIMAWSHTVIGSDGELAGAHPRGFGAFTRFLGHYIRERNVISLEEGIRRITSLSAQYVGIAERGSIQVGDYADLVLFDPERVSDRATPEAPHVPSLGIEKVWVNGQLVIEGGQITGNRPGKPIRRASP